MLYGLTGIKRSGKDTSADYICEKYNFSKLSLADPLKEACRSLFNFTDDQLYGNSKDIVDDFWKIAPRTAFTYLGTDIFRNDVSKVIPHIGDNFWVKSLESKIIANKESNIVVADLRFQNEIDMIKSHNGIVIRVTRPNIDILEHESEINNHKLENIDYEVENNGSIEELYNKLDIIINNCV